MQGEGLIFVANEGNVGVAAGWNQGIRMALTNGTQAVLVCGHDTWPMPGAIHRLLYFLQAGVPFITGTAVPYDAPEIPTGEVGPSDTLIAAPDYSFFLIPVRTIQALAMHEAQSGARISPWQLGLFDEGFRGAYFEDGDHHTRLHRAGIFAARDPGAIFRHDCSLTLRTTPAVAQMNQQTFRANGDYFRQKWGGLPHEIDTPPQARPLNVTDEQWAAMTAGRAVIELNPAQLVAQAIAVYARYGLVSQPTSA